MHLLIVSKSNLKLQVFGLFSRFVRTLIIKISSSEEPATSTSIHRVRNGGKLLILSHPSPKNVTERCRSLSWKPTKARWKYQNGAQRAVQIFLTHTQQNALCSLFTRPSRPMLSLSQPCVVEDAIFTNFKDSILKVQEILNQICLEGMYVDFRYMKIHIFALRWRDEIKRYSQLRTPLKQVVLNRTWNAVECNFNLHVYGKYVSLKGTGNLKAGKILIWSAFCDFNLFF